ncbi:phage/plasmid primase, P4 family [bacterium]|nr:phage/plasmid primase, P4 family [bacterium]
MSTRVFVETALAYAARGWPVFPLRPRAKRPQNEHGVTEATTDPAQIRAWWGKWSLANVGIACGPTSGLLVLDVDDEEGRSSLAGKPMPATLAVETGRPGGGTHFYFAHPPFPVRNDSRGEAVGPGLHVKAAGGYVVAAGSIHPTGAEYSWAYGCSPDEVALAECPQWLLEALRADADKPQKGRPAAVGPIKEGERNCALASLAGKLRRAGLRAEEMLAALQARNREYQPPLPDSEVARIAASIGRYEPVGDLEPHDARINAYRRTDSGNAELFADLFGDRVRFDHRRNRWLLFAEHRWQVDSGGELKRLVKAAARRRYDAAGRLDDKEGRTWAFSSESAAKLTACLDLAKNELPIADRGNDWDADPYLLGVPNGIVDLRTAALRDGAAADLVTKQTTVAYDPQATCPRWSRFLQEAFADDGELVNFVWRAIGYSLTGAMSEQVFFLLHGRGSNGKSVLLDLLRAVLGDYAANTGFGTFEAANRASVSCDVVVLDGARVVTASETAEAARLNESRLKAWTGGDPMTARALYAMPYSFQPCGKLWLACNHRPRVHDDSLDFWRRVRLIPFTRSFSPQAEPDLRDRLMAELPGILAWAVAGAGLWIAEGLPQPEAVVMASQQWQEVSDRLGDFLAQYCEAGENLRVPAGELFKAYQDYCDEAGLPPRERMSSTTFGTNIGERFDKVTLRHNGRPTRQYTGIGLKTA